MPYLGNPAQQRFSSPRAASVYSGDGSTVAFTLEEVVSTDEDILVSVDGVIQEPSVAYAVSSGTTLTFTAAPSNNAGNNIFVYYIARTFGSVSMPDGQNVNAANFSASGTGAITGAATVGGTLGVTGTATLSGNATIGTDSGDTRFSLNSANQYTMVIKKAGDIAGQIGGGGADVLRFSNAAGATIMEMNAGQITKPLQPAFLAHPASTITNIATGANNGLAFATERFDQNSDYNNSNYTFTAPVTGKYQANIVMYMLNLDSAVAYYEFTLTSSNKVYYTIVDPDFGQDNGYFTLTFAALIDMDAADTATIGLHQQGGNSQTDVSSLSMWSMYLVA